MCSTLSLSLSCCFFFFQAEDGIRDLVRSRGLGDVYKRQPLFHCTASHSAFMLSVMIGRKLVIMHKWDPQEAPVSYTHLTLPTSDLV